MCGGGSWGERVWGGGGERRCSRAVLPAQGVRACVWGGGGGVVRGERGC